MALSGLLLYHSMITCIVLLTVLHYGSAQLTTVCDFYENQTIYSYQPYTLLKTTVKLNPSAVTGSGFTTGVISSAITFVSFESVLEIPSAPDIFIERVVEMHSATASPPWIRLSTNLTLNNGTLLNGVRFVENIGPYLKAAWSPAITSSNSNTGRTIVDYQSPDINPGGNGEVLFYAQPDGNQGQSLPSGYTFFSSYLSFNDTGTSVPFGPLNLDVCLKATFIHNTSIIYQHGFTALTFFCAMLLGFILVVFIAFIIFFVLRRRGSSVSPSKHDENRIKAKGKKIVMDPKAAIRKGLNVIKDYSIMGWNESIVLILSMKDKLHMFREIDNLDILATIHVDTDLEKEQNEVAIQTSQLLVQGLRHNGDISKQTEDKVINNFNNNLKDLDKKLEADYKKELEVVYTDLSAKNKEKLSELLQKHRQQKQQAITSTRDLPDKEREGLLKLIDEQHEMEDNELTFTLALEQNEEAEKLRKEFAIRKRMGIKELQQGMMAETVSEGKLLQEQADWLLKEHKKQQEAVHKMYDEEISRQRMALEDKLTRRRALAHASETQEDDQTEMLNITASHVIDYLQKARKKSLMTNNMSEDWIQQMKANALMIKTDLEKTTKQHEKDLHKKLSQTKVSRLNELMKKHELEIQEFAKRNKAQQTEGPVDPISYANSLLKLKSGQRIELANLENQLDEEHAKELIAARDQISDTAQEKLNEMERDTIQNLKAEGMPEQQVALLMGKHQKEKNNLRATQLKNREHQEAKLKDEMDRRRRERAERRERERQEQEDLREHEARVVEKLVNSQVSMSEAERDRIMKEHEKQMVLLENSLTLNKLRQQRALEERLNQKRAQQMSKLQAQQQTEVVKQRKTAEHNGEEDEEETHQEALELMKKHAQQRIAIMQGEQLSIDDELEEIRIEMMKDRALALKGQEERLGAMITALQMEKAREMTRIGEQQKAINHLKANLMDDLNERGILSTPECERILDVHRQESEALNSRLETQRANQEKMLRSKIEARMMQREQTMLAKHEAEMRQVMGSAGNKFGAKVRRAMLIHKHLVEMEKFRNRMDREITQSLAEIRRQFEVTKLSKLQEQELAFVAGLVRVGCFQQNELLDVLHMLFPGKTEDDIQNVLKRIMDGVEQPSEKDMKKLNKRRSTIVERIYQARYGIMTFFNRGGSASNSDEEDLVKKKKKLSKKESRQSMNSGQSLGTINEPDYDQDAGTYNQRNPRNSFAGYTNPAYDDQPRRNTRTSVSYGPDYSDRRKSSVRMPDGNYGPNYDEGMDFIALGASMTRDDHGMDVTGHLPPLESQERTMRGKKKKKKKSMLKKHQQHEADYD